MPRIARLVVPGVAHHVTQRGNRGQQTFFSDDDYGLYKSLIADGCAAAGVSCLAWCLMPNHVHLILVPPAAQSLRAAIAEAHRRYSAAINRREGCTGFLWQGRFASYPMSDAHLMAAIRYVELNPVRAGLADKGEDWRWSSARAHVDNRVDGLTDLSALAGVLGNWRAMLANGLEAGDVDEAEAAAMEAALSTGRPRGDEDFRKLVMDRTGREIVAGKRGRPPRAMGTP